MTISGCSRNASPVAPQIAALPETPSSTNNSTKKTPTKKTARATRIVWEKNFEAALAKAKSSGKPIMIDVYAVWCGPCKLLDKQIYTARPVIDESANFINIKVDGEKRPDVMSRYGLNGFPTVILADGDGKVIQMLPGVLPVDDFVEFMRSGRTKHMLAKVIT
jgi:thiol:disulfide interchange protein